MEAKHFALLAAIAGVCIVGGYMVAKAASTAARLEAAPSIEEQLRRAQGQPN